MQTCNPIPRIGYRGSYIASSCDPFVRIVINSINKLFVPFVHNFFSFVGAIFWFFQHTESPNFII